jgi:hypothetical protein
MKRIAVALIVLAGCGSPGGASRFGPAGSGAPGRVAGVVSGPGGAMENVFVCFSSGVPAEPPVAGNPAEIVLDRKGAWRPRVLAMREGQILTVRNETRGEHGPLAIQPVRNRQWSFSLPDGGAIGSMQFDQREFAIPLRCFAHAEYHAWIHVADHRYFAVTGPDGAFAIEGVPPGEYEIFAWHEGAPKDPIVKSVRIEPGRAAAVDFIVGGK